MVLKANARMIKQPQENSADGALGGTAGNQKVLAQWTVSDGTDGNTTTVILRHLRISDGQSHNSSAAELVRKIDATLHGFVRWHDTGVHIGHDNDLHWEFKDDGDMLPGTPEALDIGAADAEVDNIFLENAATVSDARTKIDLGAIDGKQALAFIDKLDPRWFQKKNLTIPAKTSYREIIEKDPETGKETRRTEQVEIPEKIIRHSRPHAGFMAQQFKEAMTAAGIEDFAGYAYDKESDTHLLRLMEMIGILTAAVKHLAAGHVAAPPVERPASEPPSPPPEPAGPMPEPEEKSGTEKKEPQEEEELRDIDIRGVIHKFSQKDGLALMGAFIVTLAREVAELRLQTGEVVEVTIDDIEHIGRQLAGKEP